LGEQALGASSDRFPSVDPKEGSLPCRVVGCPRRTSDKKPFCLDHLVLNPYARKVAAELVGMTTEQILGPPDPFGQKKEKKRQVIPIEVQVGETRYWVGLVRARGVEVDPEPAPPTNPRRLRPEFNVKLRPFTRLLSREQSRHVLLLLQERAAERIPSVWLVSDPKLIGEVMRRFSSSPPRS
jgi:hypothetical protein